MAVLAIDQILPAVGYTAYAATGVCVSLATMVVIVRILTHALSGALENAPDLRGPVLAVLLVSVGTLILTIGVLAGMVWPATLVTGAILNGGWNDRGPSRPMLA